MEFARGHSSDVLIATDPDADRIGVMLRKDNGDYELLNGNQIASIFIYYICSQLKETGKMPAKPAMVTTIVSSPILLDIALHYNVGIEETLTGFKWIGMKMREYEKSGINFLFGCEESHGDVAGNFVRDKDAVIGASLFAELSAYYKQIGKSAYNVLLDIYCEFGYYRDSQKSVTMKGMEGAEEINKLMDKIRKTPPASIMGHEVLTMTDIENGRIFNVKKGKKEGKLKLPSSNVIVLKLDGKTRIIARPSGTEPKIKFYFSSYGRIEGNEDILSLMKRVDQDHEKLKEAFIKEMGL